MITTKSFQFRRTAAALGLGAFVAYGNLYVTQPLLPLLSGEFGVSALVAGLSVSLVELEPQVMSTVDAEMAAPLAEEAALASAIAEAADPRLHVFVSTSDIHLTRQLKKSREEAGGRF